MIGKNTLTVKEAVLILENTPLFIREEIDQDETMFNLRTKKYIVRGLSSALVQLDCDSEEYFHCTMPYHSSFYSECVLMSDLRHFIESNKPA